MIEMKVILNLDFNVNMYNFEPLTSHLMYIHVYTVVENYILSPQAEALVSSYMGHPLLTHV